MLAKGATSLAGLFAAGALIFACATLADISDTVPSTSPVSPEMTGKPNETSVGGVTIAADDYDFGDIPCGDEATATKFITLQNTSDKPADYAVMIADATAFRIEGTLTGTLPANNGVVILKVFAKTQSSLRSLTDVVITAGSAVKTVHFSAHGTGGTFTLSPQLVSFGDVRRESGGGPLPVTVTNRGTTDVTVNGFSASTNFTITPATLTIQAGKTATLNATLTANSMDSPLLHEDLKPTIKQKLCGSPPVLTLEGKRVNSSVTLSSGDFGKHDCAPQPNAKDIVLSNYSATALTYTTVVPSSFSIVSGDTGSLAPGSTATPTTAVIKVRPNAYGSTLGTIQGDLIVNIPALQPPDGGMRKVPLKIDYRGAVVTVSTTMLTGFGIDSSTARRKTYTASNTGNDLIYLNWSFVLSAGGNAWSGGGPTSLLPGDTKTGTVDFLPASPGTYEATLLATRTTNFFGEGAVSCKPLPTITLQGTRP